MVRTNSAEFLSEAACNPCNFYFFHGGIANAQRKSGDESKDTRE